MDAEIIAHVCPPRCNAGGDEAHGGHVFDQSVNFYKCTECGNEWGVRGEINSKADANRELRDVAIAHAGVAGCPLFTGSAPRRRYAVRCVGGSSVCRCGQSAMDFDLMRLP